MTTSLVTRVVRTSACILIWGTFSTTIGPPLIIKVTLPVIQMGVSENQAWIALMRISCIALVTAAVYAASTN